MAWLIPPMLAGSKPMSAGASSAMAALALPANAGR